YGQLLRESERRYHCGGVCEAGSPLFGWPLGTGKGGVVPPESAEDLLLEPCVKGIVEDLHQQASSNATVSLAAAIPLLLSGLCGSLICCSRAQKRLGRNRQRRPYQLASSGRANAWGQDGHFIIAAIAERIVSDRVIAGVNETLGRGQDMIGVAAWADTASHSA
ncbi:hypothetical protein FOZ62_010514, partial [Perkinsus olseni]